MQQSVPKVIDDGLYTPSIGIWAKRKYELLSYYSSLFATSMLKKWDCRIYIDLFSGPGRGKVKRSNEIILTSPLLAIEIRDKFDKYIYCDIDQKCMSALRTRIVRDYSKINVEYILGDTNDNVTDVLKVIPAPSKRYKVLSFCFVDPFNMRNIHFETIKSLSKIFVDFLILIPAYMDAHRNIDRYLNPKSDVVENFVGNPDWRDRWSLEKPGTKFGSFVADEFGHQMSSLGYSYSGLNDTVLVREPSRNIPLYRLAFFSRNQLGVKFWKQARQYTQKQLSLF